MPRGNPRRLAGIPRVGHGRRGTSHPRANCVEPLHPFADLTPEKLQKELKAFIKTCAPKPGIEKALSVRKWIESVRYTKKTIGVDFVLVGSETEKQEATTTERGDVPRRSIDGEDPMEGDCTPSARSAENGENLIPSDVRCRAGGTIGNEGNSVARIPKDSQRLETSDPFQPGGVSKMAEGEGFEPSRILRPYTISSRADSAALAPFLRSCRPCGPPYRHPKLSRPIPSYKQGPRVTARQTGTMSSDIVRGCLQ
jgi:hypothetical protein